MKPSTQQEVYRFHEFAALQMTDCEGSWCQRYLTAASARSVGESLIRLADEIDSGKSFTNSTFGVERFGDQ